MIPQEALRTIYNDRLFSFKKLMDRNSFILIHMQELVTNVCKKRTTFENLSCKNTLYPGTLSRDY